MRNDDSENLNDMTVRSYQEHFQEYVANTPQEFSDPEFKNWIDSFVDALPQGARILELGSASGRDARYVRSKGIDVLCTDVIPEALEALEHDGFKTARYDFRDPFPKEWLGAFDGLFANAVLLHAPEDIFQRILKDMRSVVKKNGIIGFSLLNGTNEEVTTRRISAPRYFNYHTLEELEKMLPTFGYEILWLRHAENMKWIQVIIRNMLA